MSELESTPDAYLIQHARAAAAHDLPLADVVRELAARLQARNNDILMIQSTANDHAHQLGEKTAALGMAWRDRDTAQMEAAKLRHVLSLTRKGREKAHAELVECQEALVESSGLHAEALRALATAAAELASTREALADVDRRHAEALHQRDKAEAELADVRRQWEAASTEHQKSGADFHRLMTTARAQWLECSRLSTALAKERRYRRTNAARNYRRLKALTETLAELRDEVARQREARRETQAACCDLQDRLKQAADARAESAKSADHPAQATTPPPAAAETPRGNYHHPCA